LWGILVKSDEEKNVFAFVLIWLLYLPMWIWIVVLVDVEPTHHHLVFVDKKAYSFFTKHDNLDVRSAFINSSIPSASLSSDIRKKKEKKKCKVFVDIDINAYDK
jgi:hypothetical protein